MSENGGQSRSEKEDDTKKERKRGNGNGNGTGQQQGEQEQEGEEVEVRSCSGDNHDDERPLLGRPGGGYERMSCVRGIIGMMTRDGTRIGMKGIGIRVTIIMMVR